jgi:L1 cell adhesion molecule like protein
MICFSGDEILFGSQVPKMARNKISEFRNLLGLQISDPEVQDQISRLQANLGTVGDKLVYEILDENGETKVKTPKELVSLFLKSLKKTTINVTHLSEEILSGIVLSIPAHFKKIQKVELVQAAKDAGFKQVLTIKEPVAAALAFQIKDKDSKIVVLDLGGHQFNVSCLLYSSGLYSLVSSEEDEKLGGTCFDKVLANHFVKEFKQKTRIDITDSKRSLLKLHAAAEITKKTLSKSDIAPCSVESLSDGIDFNSNMNKIRFEMLADSIFKNTITTIHSALKGAKWTTDDVDQVLFVGGASRIPKFRSMVSEIFTSSVLRTDVEPDEATAIGCALHAEILLKHPDFIKALEAEDVTETLATSKAIGVEVMDGKFHPIILKDTLLPCQRSVDIKVSKDQKEVFMAIYEGDHQLASQNKYITSVCLDHLAAESEKVVLTLTLELDGSFTVAAKDSMSGKSCQVVLPHH